MQCEIDLHGLIADEAHDALADFLADARSRGVRCVRVIHGKGLTSPNREPVLKGKVRRWLSHWDDVLAYCEAPRHAGGGGAVARPAARPLTAGNWGQRKWGQSCNTSSVNTRRLSSVRRKVLQL